MAIQNKVTISEKDVSGYMQQRDNGEHLKIKSPSEYQDDIMSYFSDDVKGGIELPFVKTQEDFRIRMGELTIVSGWDVTKSNTW